jgi:anti-sigma factor RsiW
MSMSTECARLRILLGVYVLGAIEPAERAAVDAHLSRCHRCRDELAALAGLPALLGRVTEEQIAQLSPPPADLLDPILGQVAGESRTRRRRNRVWLAVAAAALVVATGTGVGVATRIGDTRPAPAATNTPRPLAVTGTTLSGNDPATGIRAWITMQPKHWGTAFAVRLAGAPPGARCRLIVIDKQGRSDVAGGWQVEYEGWGNFYGSSMIPRDEIASVEVRTVEGRRLLRVRA